MKDITIANLALSHKDERIGMDRYVPLGTLYLVSALEEEGYSVDFRDYQVYTFKNLTTFDEQLDPNNFLSFLQDASDIIGISCTSDLLPFAILAIEYLKKESPKKTIILGGIGPTGVAENILKNFSFIDIVVRGEGERTIVQLMNQLLRGKKDLREVRGISYRDGSDLLVNPPQEPISNLDEIVFPAYDRVNFEDYCNVGIISTRGCPFTCTFCDSAPFWCSQYTQRSIKNILAEIELLREKYMQEKIELCDDLFFLNKARCFDFCNQLIERRLDIKWSCSARIDLMDEELMERMAESGCTLVFYGIESGSDKILKRIRKGFTREQAKEIIPKSLKYFDVMASFIWGFPFETMEDFFDTMNFILFVLDKGAIPWLFLLCPFPHSYLYRLYKDTLCFSEELCSNMIGADKTERMVSMIKRYPDVFPGFYHYSSKGVEQKYIIAKELGRPYLSPEHIREVLKLATTHRNSKIYISDVKGDDN